MFYDIVKIVLRPLFRLFFRPAVIGEHRIPRSGGALLASNHQSMCDSLFLPVMTRGRVKLPREEGVLHRPRPQGPGEGRVRPRDRTHPA